MPEAVVQRYDHVRAILAIDDLNAYDGRIIATHDIPPCASAQDRENDTGVTELYPNLRLVPELGF